jgi:predicted nucleotidyltransferase
MLLSVEEKERIKNEVVTALRSESEVRRVVVFGSFFSSNDPNDIDIAIFQDSNEDYLPLARKYRRLLRNAVAQLPADIVPVRPDPQPSELLSEIMKGQTIYEN